MEERYKNKYKNKKEYFLVYKELINAAEYQGVISYQEVAKIMGLPLIGNYMSKEIGQILGEISQNEHDQGRPMLSAIAVSKGGLTGDGFFNLAKVLGYSFEDTEIGKKSFLEDMSQKVYKVWSRKYK